MSTFRALKYFLAKKSSLKFECTRPGSNAFSEK